jgi:hypothetical protein
LKWLEERLTVTRFRKPLIFKKIWLQYTHMFNLETSLKKPL